MILANFAKMSKPWKSNTLWSGYSRVTSAVKVKKDSDVSAEVPLLVELETILGLAGACCRGELTKRTFDDIEDRLDIIIFTIQDSKTILLDPAYRGFFLNYKN
ncbi:hypothetical protein JTB14_016662 [Gonioctena quinquepunctata]|nr:hypothetical protein JTB14_028899 [Gonioctena quinquepunctata]KAG5882380.1 hypothetical protein JTB14_016662 [Gonioctena quinquepunctata]